MALTRLPPPPGSSAWDALGELTETGTDPEPGMIPVAVGGRLDVATMVGAYRRGVVPWAPTDPAVAAELAENVIDHVRSGAIPNLSTDEPPSLRLPWWSPNPRGVIPVGGLHVSRSLRTRLRSCGWTATVDHAFTAVVRGCARGGANGWITPELVELYTELHELGWAHSSEVWEDDELVGGHFGVLVGAVYIGDSMFRLRTDASKVALVDVDARLAVGGAELIDVQFPSSHLTNLGAREVAREHFMTGLRALRDRPVRVVTDRMPVSRLVGAP